MSNLQIEKSCKVGSYFFSNGTTYANEVVQCFESEFQNYLEIKWQHLCQWGYNILSPKFESIWKSNDNPWQRGCKQSLPKLSLKNKSKTDTNKQSGVWKPLKWKLLRGTKTSAKDNGQCRHVLGLDETGVSEIPEYFNPIYLSSRFPSWSLPCSSDLGATGLEENSSSLFHSLAISSPALVSWPTSTFSTSSMSSFCG